MKVEALRAKPVNNLASPKGKHAMTQRGSIQCCSRPLCRGLVCDVFLRWLQAASAGEK
jgi:hypothetical protein